jgi:hypothetical protein
MFSSFNSFNSSIINQLKKKESSLINTVAPVISGVFATNQQLTVSNGTWTGSPTSYTYQWFWKIGGDLVGETSSVHTVTVNDITKVLKCKVTAINSFGPTTVESDLITIITTNLLQHLNASAYSSGPTWTATPGNNVTLYGTPLPVYTSNVPKLQFISSVPNYGDMSSFSNALTVFTLEAWVYFDSINATGGFINSIFTEVNSSGIDSNNFIFGLNGSTFQFGYACVGGYSASADLLPGAIVASKWYHLVGTYDGSNLKMYVNGALSQTTSSTITPKKNGNGIRIARRWDNNNYTNIKINTIRVYENYAFSVNQVNHNFNVNRADFSL